MRSLRLIATVIALLLRNLTSCPEVRFTWVNDGLSVILHSVDAEMIPTSVPRTGRAAYLSPDGFGLFHTVDWSSGRGSWQFGNVTDLANPLAAADSYAVLPHLVNSAYFMLPAISSGWKGTYHESARSLNIAVECTSSAHGAVFLQSSQLQADLSGFYIRQYSIQSTTPLFRQVTGPNEQKPKYLFPLLPPGRCESEGCQTTWLVGDEPFVDAGLAFTKVARVVSEADGAESVADDLIKAALAGSLRWHFVVTPEGEAQFPWVEDPEARLVAAAPGEDLYLALERERQSYRDPQSPSYRGPSQSSQPYLLLGSGVPMPQVGRLSIQASSAVKLYLNQSLCDAHVDNRWGWAPGAFGRRQRPRCSGARCRLGTASSTSPGNTGTSISWERRSGRPVWTGERCFCRPRCGPRSSGSAPPVGRSTPLSGSWAWRISTTTCCTGQGTVRVPRHDSHVEVLTRGLCCVTVHLKV